MKIADMEHRKKQALKDYGILNDVTEGDSPKKWIHYFSDTSGNGMLYAFVYDSKGCDVHSIGNYNKYRGGYGLWSKPYADEDKPEYDKDSWHEVSDLQTTPVSTYKELKKIAIAIGWIENTNDTWMMYSTDKYAVYYNSTNKTKTKE